MKIMNNPKIQAHTEASNLDINTVITIQFYLKGLVPPRNEIIKSAVKAGFFTFKNKTLKPTSKCVEFVKGLLELARAEGQLQ